MTDLKGQISVFSQQTVGGKSYVKDLNELRGQLAAAIRVQNERSLPPRYNYGVGSMDFSRVDSN